jgi:hypothetical protein
MKTTRRVLVVLVLYIAYTTVGGAILTRAAAEWANTQTGTVMPLVRPAAGRGTSRVEIAIISNDADDALTVLCVTTRDRVSSDVLLVRGSDDLARLQQELGCEAPWSS